MRGRGGGGGAVYEVWCGSLWCDLLLHHQSPCPRHRLKQPTTPPPSCLPPLLSIVLCPASSSWPTPSPLSHPAHPSPSFTLHHRLVEPGPLFRSNK